MAIASSVLAVMIAIVGIFLLENARAQIIRSEFAFQPRAAPVSVDKETFAAERWQKEKGPLSSPESALSNLYRHDLFCIYDDAHYFIPDSSAQINAITPKAKYEYRFPFALVPVWAGISQVRTDGRIDDYGVNAAKEKFPNQKIFPSYLSLYYAEAQIFSWPDIQGIGKEIIKPYLPKERLPIQIKSTDNHYYDAVPVESTASDRPLTGIYYVDGSNGNRTYFKTAKKLIGPSLARSKVEDLPVITSRLFSAKQLSYLTSGDNLFWTYAIIPRSGTVVEKVAIVNAETQETKLFESRDELEAWVMPSTVPAIPAYAPPITAPAPITAPIAAPPPAECDTEVERYIEEDVPAEDCEEEITETEIIIEED